MYRSPFPLLVLLATALAVACDPCETDPKLCAGEPVTISPRTEDSGAKFNSPTEDTGFAPAYYRGTFSTRRGELEEFRFGIAIRDATATDWLCTVDAPFEVSGPAPSDCPECAWAFGTDGPGTTSRTEGCSRIMRLDGEEPITNYAISEWWPGAIDGVAFAESYPLPGYADITAEDVLFLHYSGVWYAFGFNVPSYDIYYMSGSSEAGSLTRPLLVDYEGTTYWYYAFYAQ